MIVKTINSVNITYINIYYERTSKYIQVQLIDMTTCEFMDFPVT